MCRLISHDEKTCGLLACLHSHACQHAHSLQVETLPHFWTRLESEKCFQMRSGADTLKDKGGLSGSSASWVFPGLHPRVAFKPGSPAVVRSMHIPPWMPRYLCEGVNWKATSEQIRHLPSQMNLATETLCCFHKRLLVLSYYQLMAPLPSRCAGCSWKNVGWVGRVVNTFHLLDHLRGWRACRVSGGKSSCVIKVTVENPRSQSSPYLWLTAALRKFRANFVWCKFFKRSWRSFLYKNLRIFTSCQLTETSGSTTPAKHNTSVGQGPFYARAWLLQVWSPEQWPQHLLGAG